ncbi:GAD-like domain-containing protein [Microbacterium aurum]
MVEIADFVPHAPVPREIVDEYRGRVPDELIEVWENYGYGTFGEGFLRIIDPKLYEAEVGDCIGKTQGDGIAIPVMTTGLGDLITWEPSAGFIAIMYRLGDTQALGRTFEGLILFLEDEILLEDLKAENFPEAVAAHGELPYNQSFIFVPLLSMGGKAKVENLHKRDTIASIQVAVDLQGIIGH